ncbi:LRR.XII-like protein [Cinnamomum micranthum f. kanehirae]|uniref:non-specific serine/threonine protein kinase n=1 Tax=Cinnamomum micranthum f. kanehirae TaxID=337451 RepID=A0A3S3N564_9MAGN|nr:LRR.XII-like protein [Cinnamomum micranthum f. kanehirae]
MASSSFVLYLLILLVYLNLQALECASSLGNETDRAALLAIKDRITSDPLGALSSWNGTLHFCMWPGVACSTRHQRVVSLDLSSLKLKGSMSPYIGNLSFLRSIRFAHNSFHGEIPQEINRLFRLQYLSLRNNSFQGEILTNLTSLSHLRVIDLEDNNFVGNIPVELGSLSSLDVLSLLNNYLTGNIPPSLGNLSSLTILSLAGNRLDGSIPNDLGRLSKLRIFQVSQNKLAGVVPHTLYNISAIELFNVGSNQLHGSLPRDMGITLPNLREFWGADNQFTGHIPVTLSNASKLVEFDLGSNNFVGQVPISLGDLQNLSWLSLGENQLGTRAANDLRFLMSLSNSSRLEELHLQDNSFGGTFPSCIVNLTTNLRTLYMGGNQLSGSIPSGIENLVNLIGLGMQDNFLTGTIPFTIGRLSKLQGLYLSNNKFMGEIPMSIGNITWLTELNLSKNRLSGRIPESLGKCQHLKEVDLSHNNLNGTIPKQVVGLNQISLILNLSQNLLTGPLPLEVGSLINLANLDISRNKLSGEIPSTLGNCIQLEHLYMDNNHFQGTIPTSLSTLRSIQRLDLSSNELSGQIPEYFNNFPLLLYLNLSFNDLNGEVPKEGAFKNASVISVIGNKGLCGGIPVLQLPNCNLNASKKQRGSFLLKIAVPTFGAVLSSVLILGVLGVYYCKRSSKKKSSFNSSMGRFFMKVTYQELQKATNGFSSDNLIGAGSHGSVYKGAFNIEEKNIAVKVLNLENRGASKSFIAECRTLRNVRHRNLVKVLSACSGIDFKGNDFKALIFEYMPNGNLDKWLHSEKDGQNHLQSLSFTQRLNIAIDVACALEYLHHHCQPPIAHCDLKPSNILLDNDMIAHVGDFGLAKLLYEAGYSSSHNQSDSFAIKGSIGYVPPEYGLGGQTSTKGDVYSFGILLLEMVTGRRPTDEMFKDGLSLHEFAKMALSNQSTEIVDPLLFLGEGEADFNNIVNDKGAKILECLNSIVRLGVTCSLESPEERMEMIDIVKTLQVVKDMFVGLNAF